MDHDVFISYSSHDKNEAFKVCKVLEDKGIGCWIAPRDVRPGANYGRSIINGITHCKLLLLVFSEHSNRSPHIMREVERAVSKNIRILPMRLEDITPSEGLEYFISTTHWFDTFPLPIDQHLDKVIQNVEMTLINDLSRGTPEPESSLSDEDRNYLSFVLGREISLFILYGEQRTKGRFWLFKNFDSLGVGMSRVRPLLQSDDKQERIDQFETTYIHIGDELRGHFGDIAIHWFDLGLTLTTIGAKLLDLKHSEKGEDYKSLEDLTEKAMICLEDLEITKMVDLTKVQEIIKDDWASIEDLDSAYKDLVKKFRTIEARFGK